MRPFFILGFVGLISACTTTNSKNQSTTESKAATKLEFAEFKKVLSPEVDCFHSLGRLTHWFCWHYQVTLTRRSTGSITNQKNSKFNTIMDEIYQVSFEIRFSSAITFRLITTVTKTTKFISTMWMEGL